LGVLKLETVALIAAATDVSFSDVVRVFAALHTVAAFVQVDRVEFVAGFPGVFPLNESDPF
jgi:hypothetical protein